MGDNHLPVVSDDVDDSDGSIAHDDDDTFETKVSVFGKPLETTAYSEVMPAGRPDVLSKAKGRGGGVFTQVPRWCRFKSGIRAGSCSRCRLVTGQCLPSLVTLTEGERDDTMEYNTRIEQTLERVNAAEKREERDALRRSRNATDAQGNKEGKVGEGARKVRYVG